MNICLKYNFPSKRFPKSQKRLTIKVNSTISLQNASESHCVCMIECSIVCDNNLWPCSFHQQAVDAADKHQGRIQVLPLLTFTLIGFLYSANSQLLQYYIGNIEISYKTCVSVSVEKCKTVLGFEPRETFCVQIKRSILDVKLQKTFIMMYLFCVKVQ